jgi:hypothetical protein
VAKFDSTSGGNKRRAKIKSVKTAPHVYNEYNKCKKFKTIKEYDKQITTIKEKKDMIVGYASLPSQSE